MRRLHTGFLAAAMVALFVSPAGAAAGTTTRVSVAYDGSQSNGISEYAVVSSDGRLVAFLSTGDLVPGHELYWNTYLRDVEAGTTTYLGQEWTPWAFTAKGELLFTDAIPGGGLGDLYSYDLATSNVALLVNGSRGVNNVSASSDGRFVVFDSRSDELVPGDPSDDCGSGVYGRWSCEDIFVLDRNDGTIAMASVSSAEVQSNWTSFNPSVSADGRFVVFESNATNLVPGDTNNARDVFVRDLQAGTTTRINVSPSGEQANIDEVSLNASISGDGRYVAFESQASNLVSGDTNGYDDDIFVRDMQAATTTRVNVSSGGAQANDYSGDPVMTPDGRYVVFRSSATNLVSNDTNGKGDIFVRDRQTGTTSRVSVSSKGTQANYYSSNSTVSADGRFVAFQSQATNLVPGDTNGAEDIFVRDREGVPAAGPQPDALIKKTSDASWLGDGVYDTTGQGQTRKVSVRAGKSAAFNVKVQNDGTVTDIVRLSGCANSAGFKVGYTAGATDVTSQVVAGTYSTGTLDLAGEHAIILKIKAKAGASGKSKTCLVTAGSAADSSAADAVKAVVKVR